MIEEGMMDRRNVKRNEKQKDGMKEEKIERRSGGKYLKKRN